jgi:hypothetical protein
VRKSVNWKIVVVIFAVAVPVGAIGFGLMELEKTRTKEEIDGLISKPLDDLLPSRDDMADEWLIGSSSDVTLNVSGLTEGSIVSYYKQIGSTHSQKKEYLYFTTFFVYRFSDADSASMCFDKEVNKIKSDGSYKEVAISGVFAVIYDYGTTEEGLSWGHKSNIVFSVYVYNNAVFEAEGELIVFTNLLKSKIT